MHARLDAMQRQNQIVVACIIGFGTALGVLYNGINGHFIRGGWMLLTGGGFLYFSWLSIQRNSSFYKALAIAILSGYLLVPFASNGGFDDLRGVASIFAVLVTVGLAFGPNWTLLIGALLLVFSSAAFILNISGNFPEFVDETDQSLPQALVASFSIMFCSILVWLRQVYSMRCISEELDAALAQEHRLLRETSKLAEQLKAQTESLKETNHQLTHRSQQQDRMFGIIAHELRTPAAAIDMAIRDPAQFKDPSSGQPKVPDFLSESASHLLSVIDDLRVTINPAESVEIRMAPFRFSALSEEIDRQLAPVLRNSQMHFESDWPAGGEDQYVSDAYRIRAILTNLLRNAAYHSQGTRVRLSLELQGSDSNTPQAIFTVEDDGIGIPLDQVDRLFAPFERGHTRSAGTGVGLHIVRTWTELLGGEVNLLPGAWGGARFVVRIPLAPHKHIASEHHETAIERLRRKAPENLRLLIVEDDRILRQLTRAAIRRELEVEADTATDGVDALELLSKTHFDVVVSDYFMPNMDGKSLIRNMRESGSNIPIIAVTAATIGEEQRELEEAGANIVLPKPLHMEALAEALLGLELRADGTEAVAQADYAQGE